MEEAESLERNGSDLAFLRSGAFLHTDGLLAALAGSRVGRGALPAHRQAAAMAYSTITLDRLQTLQVLLDFPAQIPFHGNPAFIDGVGDRRKLLVGQFARPDARIDSRPPENLVTGRQTDTVNKTERRFDAFFIGNFNSENSGHGVLLMIGWEGKGGSDARVRPYP